MTERTPPDVFDYGRFAWPGLDPIRDMPTSGSLKIC
jgi:hypothetical protein